MNKNLIFLLAFTTTMLSAMKPSPYAPIWYSAGPERVNLFTDLQTVRNPNLAQVYPDSPLTITLEQIAAGELSQIDTRVVHTIFITRSNSQQELTPELMERVIKHFQHVEHIKLIDLGLLIDEEQEFLSHFHNLKSVKVIENTHTKLGAPSQKNPGTLKWRLLSSQDIVEQRLAAYRDQQQTEASNQTPQPITVTPESANLSSNRAPYETTVGPNNTNLAPNSATLHNNSDIIRYQILHDPSSVAESRYSGTHTSGQASTLRPRSGIESFISRLNTQRLVIYLSLRIELIKALQGISSTPPNLLNLAIRLSNIYRALIQLRERRQSLSASSTDTIAYSPDQTTFAVPDSERDQIRIYSANSHTGQLNLTATVSSTATTEESQQRSDLDCQSIEEVD